MKGLYFALLILAFLGRPPVKRRGWLKLPLRLT